MRNIKLELQTELEEINQRLYGITNFMNSILYNELSPAYRIAMDLQARSMTDYRNALLIRIELHEATDKNA